MLILWTVTEYFVSRIIDSWTLGESVGFTTDFIPCWAHPVIWISAAAFISIPIFKAIYGNGRVTFGRGLKKLLTNAVGFKWLSIIFIFVFGIQITGLFDLGYQIIADVNVESRSMLINYLAKAILFISSIFIINALFPSIKKDNSIDPTAETLLVTAFSISYNKTNQNYEISKRNIDGFMKPLEKDKLIRYENISDKKPPKVILSNCTKISVLISKQLKEATLNSDTGFNRKDIDQYNALSTDNRIDKFKELLTTKLQNKINKDIQIYFSKPVDYEDFNEVYAESVSILKQHECGNVKQTVIHISPGVVVVSGVLTALSMKNLRFTLYTKQNEPHGDNVIATNVTSGTFSGILDEILNEEEQS